jgi:hypothetical protein
MKHEERLPGSVSLTTLSKYQSETEVRKQLRHDQICLYRTPGRIVNEDTSFFYGNMNNSKKAVYQQASSNSQKRTVAMFPCSFISEADLSKWLSKVGVDVTQFGQGNNRTIQNLLQEVKAGKSRIILNNLEHANNAKVPRPFEVVRVIHVTNLIIFGPQRETVLVEASRQLMWLTGEDQVVVRSKMPPSFKMNTSQFPPHMTVREGVQIGAANCLLKEFHLKVTRTLLQSGTLYTLSPEEVAATAASKRRKRDGRKRGSVVAKSLQSNTNSGLNRSRKADRCKEVTTTTSNSFPGLNTA